MFAVSCITANAQLLHLSVADTTLQAHSIILGNSMENIKFDNNGICNYNDATIKGKTKINVCLSDYSSYSAVLEPGKTLTLTISKKNGKTFATYKGDNADMSVFFNAFDNFIPEKNSPYEKMNPGSDTITHDEAFRREAASYDLMCKMINKMKDPTDRKVYKQKLDIKHLSNRLELHADRDWKYGRDIHKDADYQKLLAQINPNDTVYLDNNLINTLIIGHMPIKVDENTDVTEYGTNYINTMAQYVTHKEIKHLLLDKLANDVLSADGALDANRFWSAVKQQGDTAVINKYQYIVDSKIATKSGMKCPDITFSDAQGTNHHLSEYFGKTLYIDLWATWCGPCCMEIPYLEKHVEHYKDNSRVQFISISMDKDHAAWLKKINEDKPAWQQFSTNAKEDRMLSLQWGVMSIPRFLIINPDGTICNNDAFRPSDDDFVSKLDAVIK